jgi:nucleoside-diphosphate-sugar epimerase
MRIFVTGAAGFLGLRVVQRLLDEGHVVRCLVRSDRSEAARALSAVSGAERLELTYGSLQDHADLPGAVEGSDRVVHLAAALNGSAPALFLDTVVGTRALMAAAAGARVDRVVLISSIAVYGSQALPTGATLDENCAVDPHPHLRDAYTYSKVVQEEVCREACLAAGLPLVVLRPGVLYGPGRPVITNRVGLRFGAVLVQMGGGQELPYAYVDNCADAVALAATRDDVRAGAYNIVDDDLPTGRKLVKLCRARGLRLRRIAIPRLFIPILSNAYEWYARSSGYLLPPVLTRHSANALWRSLKFSNRRAKDELHWRPKMNTDEALGATIASQQSV